MVRENLSIESILSLGGVHRLSTNFKCWRGEKKVREEVQEIGRVKVRKNAHMTLTMWME